VRTAFLEVPTGAPWAGHPGALWPAHNLRERASTAGRKAGCGTGFSKRCQRLPGRYQNVFIDSSSSGFTQHSPTQKKKDDPIRFAGVVSAAADHQDPSLVDAEGLRQRRLTEARPRQSPPIGDDTVARGRSMLCWPTAPTSRTPLPRRRPNRSLGQHKAKGHRATSGLQRLPLPQRRRALLHKIKPLPSSPTVRQERRQLLAGVKLD